MWELELEFARFLELFLRFWLVFLSVSPIVYDPVLPCF